MPETKIQAYRENRDSEAVVLIWLNDLKKRVPKAHAKCLAAIRRLRLLGHELRRPEADLLRDDIRELRVKVQNVHYRVLYSFIGQNNAILLLGCTKKAQVDPTLIDRAIRYRKNAIRDPDTFIAGN